MREILFRGKSYDSGEWVYGNLRVSRLKDDPTDYVDIYPVNVGYPDFPMAERVYPDTVGQFTGLLDKNGRKIFEGDIVCMNTGEDECSISVYAKVQSLPNGPCLRDRETDCFVSFDCVNFSRNAPRFWEVIGNIYDNPELLGGDNNGVY